MAGFLHFPRPHDGQKEAQVGPSTDQAGNDEMPEVRKSFLHDKSSETSSGKKPKISQGWYWKFLSPASVQRTRYVRRSVGPMDSLNHRSTLVFNSKTDSKYFLLCQNSYSELTNIRGT